MEKIIAAIKKCNSEIETLQARSEEQRLIELAKEDTKKLVAGLKAKLRAEQVENIADGKDVCNLDLEREIEIAEKADITAIENAAKAADVRKAIAGRIAKLMDQIERLEGDLQIAKLDTFESDFGAASKSVVSAEVRLREAENQLYNAKTNKQTIVIDNLSGKFKKAVRQYTDEYLPELIARLADMPSKSSSTGASNFISVIQASSNKDPIVLDSLFHKMAYTLKPAAAIAEVQAVELKDETNKRALLKLLRELGLLVKNAVSTKNVTATEWAFAGDACWREWTAADLTEPVRQWLRELDA